MTVARRLTSILVFLLACSMPIMAQTGKPSAAVPLTLGQSMVPLYGPWKFQVGDSPINPVTNQPLWAEPGFDDSKWETVNLTPKEPVNPFRGSSGNVPGWGKRGHPGYSGYAWYRIRVRVNAQPGEQLALAGPANFADAY